MDISDFVNGSAYVKMYRSDFKDDIAFNSYCQFMKCSIEAEALKIYVVYGEPETEVNESDPDEQSEFEEIE